MTAVLGRGLVVVGDGPQEIVVAPVRRLAPLAEQGEPAPPPSDLPPATDPPGRVRRAWILPAAVVVAAALALLPTVGDDGPGPGEAEVRVEGTATVTRSEGEVAVVEDASVRLGPGDSIEVTAGTAHFTLADEVTFAGRVGPAVADRAGTTVLMGRVPELVAGPLLVEAPVPMRVRSAGAVVVVGPSAGDDGAARIDRRLGLGVGTYAGAVAVESGGQSVAVAPLRRLEVAGPGAFGRADLPLGYSEADPWDRRFLADALVVDRQLGPLLTAFDALSGPSPATVAGLRRARPGLPADGLDEVVAGAPTGSAALVTAVLADLGSDAPFASRVAAIRRFRDDGAPWGLVTLDQGVAPEALLDDIRETIDRLGPDGVAGTAEETATGATPSPTGGALPPGTEAQSDGPAPSPSTPGSGGSSSGTTPASPGANGGTGAPGPGPSPTTPGPLPSIPLPGGGGPVDDVIDGAGDVVDDILDDVGDVATGAGDTAGQVVDGAGDALGDVVDGLLDTAGRLLGGPAPPTTQGRGLLGLGGR